MALESDENPNLQKKEVNLPVILADWSLAVEAFKHNYMQLSPYANLDDVALYPPLNMGQCPPSQITSLVLDMKTCLDKMLQDLGSPIIPPVILHEGMAKKLFTHTQIINGINKHAQLLIHIVKQLPT